MERTKGWARWKIEDSCFHFLVPMFLSLFRFSAGQENGDKIIDPKGIVRWEGYPLLDGFELTEKVVADILAKPIK